MKFKAIIASALSLLVLNGAAQTNRAYHLTDINIERQHGQLKIAMDVNPREYGLKYNQQLEVIPVVRGLDTPDTLALPSFIVAGKNAYRYTERSGRADGSLLRSGHGEKYDYTTAVDWQPWMDHCRLDLVARSTGCCGASTAPDKDTPVALIDYRPVEYAPLFHYEAPVAEKSKMRRIEGKAYVNFPVNLIEIFPDYMVNPVELRKITSSIDTVRLNPDATVKSITLTGFASPEGPYLNNVRLAKGRTEAVMNYVMGQYTFPAEVFHANSVPEDWEGLRDSVAVSILPDRAEILKFINEENVAIERRNDELRRRFPVSYDYLLKNVYPSLRHTNYAIDYELRQFSNIDEIRRVLAERPQNLSLNEFFLAANSYPVGSAEYDRVFATAVLYYPDSDVANLNAANSAMNEGDLRRAEMLLSRVPDTEASRYARGVLEALKGNYDRAEELMKSTPEVAETDANLREIERIKAGRHHITFLPEE